MFNIPRKVRIYKSDLDLLVDEAPEEVLVFVAKVEEFEE